MNIKFVSLLAVLALAMSLWFTATTPAAPKTPAAATISAAIPQPAAAPATPEPHPEIRDALMALRRAKAHTESASHDFNGHRAEAVKATDEAIRQLEICLKFDR